MVVEDGGAREKRQTSRPFSMPHAPLSFPFIFSLFLARPLAATSPRLPLRPSRARRLLRRRPPRSVRAAVSEEGP